ncbi:MAG TPA: ROK family protein [Bacteroidales bacterium]|nr:ROK family protein [Bacteroidales bacterium]
MALLGIDIGGTKLAAAVFTEEGNILSKEIISLGGREGAAAGSLITSTVSRLLRADVSSGNRVESIGISVPGIYRIKEGTVWAPNIPGWDNYPLLKEVTEVSGGVPVIVDSDRACYILGEMWKGNARGCTNAIFMAVGTGIGAGIVADGRILRGAHDIAGAIGWLALTRPFRDEYIGCGCFEHHASGEGIAKTAREYLENESEYAGELRNKPVEEITSYDIFVAYHNADPLAIRVIKQSIEYWGMAVANLISLFNPEKIILGGGVFGPAVSLIPDITKEAARWAQPISRGQVTIEASALGGDAGVYGAGYLAREKYQSRS